MCGLPLFPPKPKHENPARPRLTFRRIAARVAGRSEAVLAVGSTVTAFPGSSQYTPASAGVCSSKGESHGDHD